MIENCKILWNGKRKQTNTKCFIDILLEIMTLKILSFSRKRQIRIYNDLYQLTMNTRQNTKTLVTNIAKHKQKQTKPFDA